MSSRVEFKNDIHNNIKIKDLSKSKDLFKKSESLIVSFIIYKKKLIIYSFPFLGAWDGVAIS